MKISVPYFQDDPLFGRMIILNLFPFNVFGGIFHDYIIIEDDMLIYKGSITSMRKRDIYYLKDMAKLLMEKRNVSCFSREGKFDFFGRLGIEIELLLVDKEGNRHVLIHRFMIGNSPYMDRSQKVWDQFLNKLCKYSGLPLEENVSST
jgi:hypothetical protein